MFGGSGAGEAVEGGFGGHGWRQGWDVVVRMGVCGMGGSYNIHGVEGWLLWSE